MEPPSSYQCLRGKTETVELVQDYSNLNSSLGLPPLRWTNPNVWLTLLLHNLVLSQLCRCQLCDGVEIIFSHCCC